MRTYSTFRDSSSVHLFRSIAFAAFACCALRAAADVRYVDDDAPAGGDGRTWATAYRFIRDAMAEAYDDLSISEVRVAGGRYTPNRDEANPNRLDGHQLSLSTRSGLALRGGFRGLSPGGDSDDRDYAAFLTILSGDLLGDDGPDFVNRLDNSRNLLVGNPPVGSDCIVEGVKFQGGRGSYGGSVSFLGSPRLSHCVFEDNEGGLGGALYIAIGDPHLSHCVFIGNFARSSGGAAKLFDGHPTVESCVFIGNRSNNGTGGLLLQAGTLRNCTFTGNYTRGNGGALLASTATADGALNLVQCIFESNIAERGGAISGGGRGGVWIVDCRFVGNSATDEGGALAAGTNFSVKNCLFAENTASLGGAVSAAYDSDRFQDCQFLRNIARQDGGAFWGTKLLSPTVS